MRSSPTCARGGPGVGGPVPETPSDEDLARTLVGGLEIAHQANRALERWQPCLDRLGEREQVQRALGMAEHEIARTRFNRYGPLKRLGKLDEAQAVLEGCLEVFRRAGDVGLEAKALSALADVWHALGDRGQALALARQALALQERSPDLAGRAVSHNNLAKYLHAAGSPAEALSHQLADLVYTLFTGLDPRISLGNLANRIHEAAAGGERFAFPAVTAVLAEPAFAPLRAFVEERAVDVVALQGRIEALVASPTAGV
jgi:tetratricopeptide (TPR) repeat protein